MVEDGEATGHTHKLIIPTFQSTDETMCVRSESSLSESSLSESSSSSALSLSRRDHGHLSSNVTGPVRPQMVGSRESEAEIINMGLYFGTKNTQTH